MRTNGFASVMIFALVLSAGVMVVLPTTSAEPTDYFVTPETIPGPATNESPARYPIYAEDNQEIGSLLVFNCIYGHVHFQFNLKDGWYLMDARLAWGDSFDDIPQTATGAPDLEEMSTPRMLISGDRYLEYLVDLSEFTGEDIVIAAEVSACHGYFCPGINLYVPDGWTEPAWASHGELPDSVYQDPDWGAYIMYDISQDEA